MTTYHEERRDDPVHEQTEAQLLPDPSMGEDLMQGLVPHLTQDGIHHDEQSDG